ncbi:preprotein translocase subunit SecG [Candidatus Francisella endociliophora]|uniref:Protein-export membrane protein SecG n=1 Tax=Candidatus Francisella endociliophora TaxID=653937 RepID=A0A097EPG6_9GAMM|nr:preprotein translocase subunit SecG [Francisella sp. FSC1006]AIT09460.1 preprotein translocase subunit SecG [Francisella sp. FSC1006]
MYEIILTIDVIAAIAIVVLVLLQQGKGADMGVSFGGGASNTVFGSKGAASFLFKATVFFTGLFFVCCLTLGYLGKTPTTTTAVSSENADKSIASQYDQYQKEAAAASATEQSSKSNSK